MLSDEVCFSGGLLSDDLVICNSGKDLIQSKNFYIMTERFCNIISREDVQFDIFLSKHFNDEGYCDVWRIPHLLLDVYQGNCRFHSKTLESADFISLFPQFLGRFYNYCVSEYNTCLIEEHKFGDIQRTVLEFKVKQQLMNITMDTFCRVLENLRFYQ